MIRGLYTSGWSMTALNKKIDVVSNNIANVNTNGFKKDTVVFESFAGMLTSRLNDTKSKDNPSNVIGTMELSNDVGEVFTYFTQGQNIETGRKLDLAIADNSLNLDEAGKNVALFTVNATDNNGQTKEYYTRNGAFSLNTKGQLVTAEGYAVLGQRGVIQLTGDNFSVLSDGTIVQNGEAIDRLRMKQFSDGTTLRKVGDHLLETTQESQETAFTGSLQQGYIEQSNVNIIKEMVDMVTVMRSYEANQKMIQYQDATLEKVVNEVGSVR